MKRRPTKTMCAAFAAAAWATLAGCDRGCRATTSPTTWPVSSAAATAGEASMPEALAPVPATGRIGHVFLLVLENEGYRGVFEDGSSAPYLARALPAQGALLTHYFGIGHNSLPNYLAMVSGQGPNPVTQQDCLVFEDFVGKVPESSIDGQAVGKGCVYPASVQTLPDQLEKAAPTPLTWKGYMEDMGNDLRRESATCARPPIGERDPTQEATPKDQYAVRHNPFVYFHSIIDDKARCDAHVVNLEALKGDLKSVGTTPNFSVIIPNLCNDGHDGFCATGLRGGLVAIDPFLKKWVPTILASPAFRQDGLLVIAFDEAETPYADSTACCGQGPSPNTDLPGIVGLGGGVTGAVVLSPFIAPGTVSATPYNHYSLLRTFEQIFGTPYLGYAAGPESKAFGSDVWSRAVPSMPPRP